jgi:hypothetical protein
MVWEALSETFIRGSEGGALIWKNKMPVQTRGHGYWLARIPGDSHQEEDTLLGKDWEFSYMLFPVSRPLCPQVQMKFGLYPPYLRYAVLRNLREYRQARGTNFAVSYIVLKILWPWIITESKYEQCIFDQPRGTKSWMHTYVFLCALSPKICSKYISKNWIGRELELQVRIIC